MRLHQTKKLQCSKETNNRIKRQCTKREKISENHTSYKGLVSKIHSKLIQFNSKDNNNKTTFKPLFKMEEVFPECPVVKTLCLQCKELGFDSWWGKIPHALWCGQKNNKGRRLE